MCYAKCTGSSLSELLDLYSYGACQHSIAFQQPAFGPCHMHTVFVLIVLAKMHSGVWLVTWQEFLSF